VIMQAHMLKVLGSNVVVLGIFLLLSLLATYPASLHPSRFTSHGGEEYLLSYLINWTGYSLFEGPDELFNPPFFYPFQQALTFSDPMVTMGLITRPLSVWFKEPMAAVTVNVILAFWLMGYFTFLLVRHWTNNYWVGIVAGVVAAYSIGRWDTLGHAQILTNYWLPLGVYGLVRWWESGQRRWVWLVGGCLLCQGLNNVFWTYALLAALGWVSLVYGWTIKNRRLTDWLLVLPVVLGMLALFYRPYLELTDSWEAARSFEDVWAGSAYFLDYVYPTQSSRLRPVLDALVGKQPWPAYMGLVVSAGGLWAGFNWLKQRQLRSRKEWLIAGMIAVFGLLMSFGPYFQLVRHRVHIPIPLPYWFAYYLVPGFQSMRSPQRWSQVALWALAILVGLWLAEMAKKKPARAKVIGVLIVVVVLLEPAWPAMTRPLRVKEEIPQVHMWLREQSPRVILEWPIQTWAMPKAEWEIERLHYQSYLFGTGHRFVNGYSGFSPPEWELAAEELLYLNSAEGLDQVQEYGIEMVLIHAAKAIDLTEEMPAIPDPYEAAAGLINQGYRMTYKDDEVWVMESSAE
jgi:hypothetical protein